MEKGFEKELTYEGYTGTVNYDKKCDYYTGEVVIDGHIYTYEGERWPHPARRADGGDPPPP